MRILQIGKFYPPYHFGGIETVSKNLHDGLENKGVTNDFLGFLPVTYKQDIAINEHIYLCKTNVDVFSVQFSISFIKKWFKYRSMYDIVIINMPHPFANLVLYIFPPKSTKIVLWWHSDIIRQRILLRFYKLFLISLIKKSAAIIAPTNTHIDQSDYAKYFKTKKYIIPYPILI